MVPYEPFEEVVYAKFETVRRETRYTLKILWASIEFLIAFHKVFDRSVGLSNK